MPTRKKILIVDDEVFFRDSLRDVLKTRYQLIEGCDGKEALTLALQHTPDLIILDVVMPESTGIEVCTELKKRPETRRIPVVLFTSLTQKEDVVKGLKAGADDYITKPMCVPEVVARIDAHLRSRDYYTDLKHEDLLLLLELSENISAIRNPMTILRIIVEKMSAIIDVARCSIVSINADGVLLVKASNDLEENREIQLDLDRYPEIRKSLETKQPVIVNNIQEDPLLDPVRSYLKDLNYNSIIVIPVIKKESVIGTFFLRTASPLRNGITERINKVCQLVANISANALENAMLFDTMRTAQEYFEEMSIRDGLTKLYNHRYFFNRLEEEFSRAARYFQALSLLFIDADNFKQINDLHGHISGDAVLQQMGVLIRSIARESDIPARYGGEEFAIILPNTSPEGAMDLAERLCRAIREHKFAVLKGDRMTVSIGVATFYDANIPSFERLLNRADVAMYRAKEQGKNRVCQAAGSAEV